MRGTSRALIRAGRGEYSEPEARPFFGRLMLCALSGAMITLSFPRYDATHLAWVALVPALLRIEMVAASAAEAPKLKIGVAQANVQIREPDGSTSASSWSRSA